MNENKNKNSYKNSNKNEEGKSKKEMAADDDDDFGDLYGGGEATAAVQDTIDTNNAGKEVDAEEEDLYGGNVSHF